MVEEIVKSKLVNFLVTDVQISPLNLGLPLSLGATLYAFNQAYGGLWVGGKLELTNSVLRLSANAANRLVLGGIQDIELPLAAIRKVSFEGGFITSIIGVQTDAGRVQFRCFGARAVATLIDQMITPQAPQAPQTPAVGRQKRTPFWR
ncbi:MAG: hypothetical protein RSE94_03990 [Pseudomonas sp.]